MSNKIVDELITRITLEDLYSAPAGKVVNATKVLAHNIDAVKRDIGNTDKNFLSGMADGFQVAIPVLHEVVDTIKQIAFAAFGATAAFAGMVAVTMHAAADFDSSERAFSAMLGSFEKGKQMMQFIQSYGLKSGFQQEPLIEATRVLTSLGLAADKYLPILEKLALLKGPQAENLTDLAEIVMRMVGGETGRAFGPEGLGRYGINRNMLEQYGAQFDKQGSFIGSTADALKTLERLTSESPMLKNLKAVFDDSPAVKLSNAVDAVKISLVKAGEVFNGTFLPAIESAGSFIAYLANSGIVADLATDFASIFGEKGSFADTTVSVLAYVVSVIEYIPSLVKTVVEGAKGFINTAIKAFNGFIEAINRVPFHDKIPGLKQIGDATSGLAMIQGLIEARHDELVRGYKDAQANPGPDVAAPSPVTDLMSQIAASTAQTAVNTKQANDMKRMILGGGELGRLGITPVELGGIRRGRNHTERRMAQLMADLMGVVALAGAEAHSANSLQRARMAF